MADLPTFFADGVLEASVRHGVARLKLAVQDGSGTPSATGLLVVPLTQLPALAGSITRLLREVEAKAKEAGAPAAPGGAAPAQPGPASEPPPAAFRFEN